MTDAAQGLRMLLADHSDFCCSTDLGVLNEQHTDAFRNVTSRSTLHTFAL